MFGSITLAVKFEVAEIKQIAPDWAIARTNSAGTVKVNATGQGGPEANQELFAFQKISDVGRSHATAFLPPTRRAHKTQGPKS